MCGAGVMQCKRNASLRVLGVALWTHVRTGRTVVAAAICVAVARRRCLRCRVVCVAVVDARRMRTVVALGPAAQQTARG